MLAVDESSIILYSTGWLRSLDLSDGSVLWERGISQGNLDGITPSGDCLMSIGGLGDNQSLVLLDQHGSDLWSLDLENVRFGMNDTIIFNDGSIIVSYQWGISQLNSDGTIRWTIDLEDAGLTSQSSFNQGVDVWHLAPTSDGGLVAGATHIISSEEQNTIFKFSLPS